MASRLRCALSVLVCFFTLSQILLVFFAREKRGDKIREDVISLFDRKLLLMKAYNAKENTLQLAMLDHPRKNDTMKRQIKRRTDTLRQSQVLSQYTTQTVLVERTKPVCSIPRLDAFSKDAMKHIKNVSKLKCRKRYISQVEDKYLTMHVDDVSAAYFEYIERPEGNDNHVTYSKGIALIDENKKSGNGSLKIRHKLTEDFVKVTIKRDGKTNTEYHAIIVPKGNVIEQANAAQEGGLKYNVAMLMVDSQSASNVKRRLRKAYEYLQKDENTFIFEGHSIVGDGTTAQLSAILAGAFEWDFPESRRGFPGGKHIDDWPFVFKNFKRWGYVTMFSEDEPMYAAFNYRLYGFKKQPTDHYARPFWLESKSDHYVEGICHGENPIHMRSFDYLMDFHDSYTRNLKFSLTILSAMIHDDLNRISNIDDDLLKFMEIMQRKGHLDNTIFILFGDHGARFEGFRETMTGKLEERLPFLSMTLPKQFLEKHTEIKQALRHNRKLLTSFFDIHATLHHMLTYPAQPTVKIGQSLFNKIDPEKRTCEAAGIKEHWCPCLQFISKNTTDERIISLANATVQFINENITGAIPQAKSMCSVLKLASVKRAGQRVVNERVRKFKQTAQNIKCIECDVILETGENSRENTTTYEIVFSVTPGNGVFEATVKVENNEIFAHPEISRLNRYGTQPECIQKEYPSLRKFCYCTK